MSYYIDLSRITINDLKKRLQNQYLLPSQKILEEDMEASFAKISQCGFANVDELKRRLKSKGDVSKFAKEAGLSEQYLTILRREVNSYHPQPRKLAEFATLRKEIITALAKTGIKDTVKLFAKVATRQNRTALAVELNASDDEVLQLAELVDFSRMRYVSPNFATMLVHSEYDTIEKIANADPEQLYNELKVLKETQGYYTGPLGQNDMKFFVKEAANMPAGVEF